MKLIVGLGNPGRAYAATRHNVGFDVVERLAGRAGGPVRQHRFQGEVVQVAIRGSNLLLLWPLTWMNLSGSSVLAARDFYKLENPDILVVCDDFQLPQGTVRLRGRGSAGGQKGLADVIRRLGTDEVPRLRVGIGPIPEGWKAEDFVLGKFARDERDGVDAILDRAADAAEEWAAAGIEMAMNRYN